MNFTHLKRLSLLLALSLSTTAKAEDVFDFDYLKLSHIEVSNSDESGYEIEISKSLSDNLFITFDYSQISWEGLLKKKESTVGVGYSFELSETDLLYTKLNYGTYKLDVSDNINVYDSTLDTDGLGLALGYQKSLTKNFTLKGELEYNDVRLESRNILSVAGDYSFNRDFSVGFELSKASEEELKTQLNVKFSF